MSVDILDPALLELLACPCDAHAPLRLDEAGNELLCTVCDRAFPIRDGIPVLLLAEARHRGTPTPEPEAADSTADRPEPGTAR